MQILEQFLRLLRILPEHDRATPLIFVKEILIWKKKKHNTTSAFSRCLNISRQQKYIELVNEWISKPNWRISELMRRRRSIHACIYMFVDSHRFARTHCLKREEQRKGRARVGKLQGRASNWLILPPISRNDNTNKIAWPPVHLRRVLIGTWNLRPIRDGPNFRKKSPSKLVESQEPIRRARLSPQTRWTCCLKNLY